MILMGDEVRRTQNGNNNAYCHDSEIAWFDWNLVDKHADVLRFVSMLIEQRVLRNPQHEQQRVSLNKMLSQANKAWHGVKLDQPDWSDNSHSIAFSAELRNQKLYFFLILNSHWEPKDFELPAPGNNVSGPWRRWIDTGLDSPNDIVPIQSALTVPNPTYRVEARSVVMLYSGETETIKVN